jgi:hypothetical protein
MVWILLKMVGGDGGCGVSKGRRSLAHLHMLERRNIG